MQAVTSSELCRIVKKDLDKRGTKREPSLGHMGEGHGRRAELGKQRRRTLRCRGDGMY